MEIFFYFLHLLKSLIQETNFFLTETRFLKNAVIVLICKYLVTTSIRVAIITVRIQCVNQQDSLNPNLSTGLLHTPHLKTTEHTLIRVVARCLKKVKHNWWILTMLHINVKSFQDYRVGHREIFVAIRFNTRQMIT